jgi:prolycopene isomerase
MSLRSQFTYDDKTLCPADKHIVAAVGPSFKSWPDSDAGEKYRTKNYLEQKQAEAERMIGVLEKNFPGFKKGLKHLEISSPATIERYTMKNWGCVAGPKQSIGQHMFNRLHVKSDWDLPFLLRRVLYNGYRFACCHCIGYKCC